MKKIICFGDSLTWGYIPVSGGRYPEGVRWPSLLGQYLDCTVVEEGLNGRTSVFRDPLAPWGTGADYIQACVLSHLPADLLILMLGTNDLKTYLCNCPDACAGGVVAVANLARAAAPQLPILILAPPPIGRHITQLDPALGMMAQLNEQSIENSWKLGNAIQSRAQLAGFAFLDTGAFVSASQADAVHLDEQGHRTLAQALSGQIADLFPGWVLPSNTAQDKIKKKEVTT